jgi:dTDP-4-amino-4,6-dideoxygalactose transaminase/predicted dehydrogenase
MKFVIIGLGHRGKKYLSALSQCHEAELVAVCDSDERSRSSITQYTRFYTDIDEMLAYEKIDAAIVAVPHQLYFEIISKLAKKKIHIIKEKPFATTVREAEDLHKVLKTNGVEMMIAVQRRFDKHYQVFKRMLKKLGHISHIRGSYTLNIDRLDSGWRAQQQQAGGGALSDMGYHFIDLLIWYFGLPADIHCQNTQGSKLNQQYDVEDSSLLNFEYLQSPDSPKQKTIGSFFLSRVSIDTGESIIVQGQKGCIKLTPDQIVFYDIHNRPEYTSEKKDTSSINPLVAMVEHFIHYLKGDIAKLKADYRTHIQHVRLIEAAYQADQKAHQNASKLLRQKMMFLSPPVSRKRDRDEPNLVVENDTEQEKRRSTEPSKKSNKDYVWPLITERTKQRISAQISAENISCYNRSGIIQQFEENFARYHGRKYALSTNSGTSAIHALYSVLSLKQGDEVLVPSNTFHATISPLMHTGATPVFVDCLANGNVDPEDMRKKITLKTKAVMITHLWGIPCEMDRIVDLCNRHKLILLEDCSHAHGARYKGKLVGTFGLAAVWSFNGPKIISGGEGGMILTDDKEIEIRCNLFGQYNNRSMQITPIDHPLRSIALTGLGLKHRITTVAAAMADEQFEHLDQWLGWKRLYANMFREALSNFPFIQLPSIEDTQPAWYAFTFYIDEEKARFSRDLFLKRSHQAGLIEISTPASTCPQEKLDLYRYPSRFLPHLYSEDPRAQDECPMSNQLYRCCIKMPMWAEASDLPMVNKYISGICEVAYQLSLEVQNDKQNQAVFEL